MIHIIFKVDKLQIIVVAMLFRPLTGLFGEFSVVLLLLTSRRFINIFHCWLNGSLSHWLGSENEDYSGIFWKDCSLRRLSLQSPSTNYDLKNHWKRSSKLLIPGRGWGIPLFGLYWYVSLDRVRFFGLAVLNRVYNLTCLCPKQVENLP